MEEVPVVDRFLTYLCLRLAIIQGVSIKSLSDIEVDMERYALYGTIILFLQDMDMYSSEGIIDGLGSLRRGDKVPRAAQSIGMTAHPVRVPSILGIWTI